MVFSGYPTRVTSFVTRGRPGFPKTMSPLKVRIVTRAEFKTVQKSPVLPMNSFNAPFLQLTSTGQTQQFMTLAAPGYRSSVPQESPALGCCKVGIPSRFSSNTSSNTSGNTHRTPIGGF
eukprot:1278839-Rhodomonas_salina.1